MAKLTKKQRLDLERALKQAEMSRDFIFKDNIVLCVKVFKGKPYRPNHYYNEEIGLCLAPVEKDYGSTLCQLKDSIATIKKFLSEN